MNAVMKFAQLAVPLLSASYYLVFSAELAKAQERIYLCDGVYQNWTCAEGERGRSVQLPSIMRYNSRTADARNRNDVEYSRGRLSPDEEGVGTQGRGMRSFSGLGEPTEAGRSTAARGRLAPGGQPASGRTVSLPARVRELSDHAAYLRSNISRLIEQDGAQQTQRELIGISVALDNVCNQETVVADEQSKRTCDGAQQDLAAAQRALPSLR